MIPRAPGRLAFFKKISESRIFPNYDLFHDYMQYLNATVENHSVIGLCKKARIQPRRIWFTSDLIKLRQEKQRKRKLDLKEQKKMNVEEK